MRVLLSIAVLLLLHACKHPLAIEGEGDIIERLVGHRGCTLEEFQANSPRCTENESADEDYIVRYEAVPKTGWTFLRWEGTACSAASVAPYCDYNVPTAWVTLWDATVPGFLFPPTVAVFGQPDTWAEKADLLTPGVGISNCVIDGKVYAVGMGFNAGTVPEHIEEYNPSTGNWTPRANIPTPSALGTAGAVDGKCYLIGGGGDSGRVVHTAVQEYDPGTDAWSSRSPAPIPRAVGASAVVDGKIYAIGGGGGFSYFSSGIGQVDIYDPKRDRWTTGADLPTPRLGAAVAAVGQYIYVMGGHLQTQARTDLAQRYDTVADSWTTIANCLQPMGFASASVLDGYIYVSGGLEPSGSQATNRAYRYDPETDRWTRLADMMQSRLLAGGAAIDGRILVFGGRTVQEGPALTSVEEYTP
jgi:N-acetylneuraminic acid mutarotase